ncbi:MAG TPA: hypothetical protein VMG82_06155 [Candidatus Sulfotelmatobacter sp.]|nr:hypothetical protein [Candidatus Sulfotelmatobacter sp.]
MYISSNANRFYCAAEAAYGQVPAITADNRIPAGKLTAKQQLEVTNRKDKTGSRTFAGLPPGGRRQTTYQLNTLLTTWAGGPSSPSYGPLFQAALGNAAAICQGGTIAAGSTSTTLVFAAPHGLSAGQGISYMGEIRFVTAVPDNLTVQLNAPLSIVPAPGSTLGPTATYSLSTELPSASIFDYWDPSSAVQRILCGAAVDQMTVKVNGDFHEFAFSGVAQDLADTTSFASGIGQLTAFPGEPALGTFDYTIVPGHLGQVWLGNDPDRFFTLTSAQLELSNNLDMRAKEFGSSLPRAISPGTRAVTLDFELYEQDDSITQSLYQAARQQSPISAMIQLGQQPNQLFGGYLKSLVPQVPEYDDGETRVKWHFRSSRAQGTVDDEIVVAFG